MNEEICGTETTETASSSLEKTKSGNDPPADISARQVESLAKKFLSNFQSDLQSTEEKLNEIQQNQVVLTESICHVTAKLDQSEAAVEIENAIKEIDQYRLKLRRIKKTMVSLKDLSKRLKKDSTKIQQLKQKDNLKKEEITNKALNEEKKLTAKLSNPST